MLRCLSAIALLTAFLIFPTFARAEDFDSNEGVIADSGPLPPAKYVDLGNNVTQTAYTFPKGRCTFGSLIVGCGVTAQFNLFTSPWLLAQYNMANLFVRYQTENRENHKSAIQFAYFKTYETGRAYPVESNPGESTSAYYCKTTLSCFNGYEMDALWFYWMRSHRITKDYVFHWNLQGAYYWDDTKPFSLRRPQAWKNPWQANLMSLHEVHILGGYYLRGEVGFLGLSDKFPALHTGMMVQYRKESWAWQLGATASGYLNAWFTTGRFDYQAQALSDSREGLHQSFSDGQLIDDFSIHPEIFVQFAFDI